MTAYSAHAVTAAVIANLVAAGLAAGDGEKPTGAGWQGAASETPFDPYVVVFPISRGFDGTLDEPFDDGSPLIQLSAYGATREQAQIYSDRAATALMTTPITIAGRHVMLVEPDVAGGPMRFDDAQPPLWQDPQRFRIHTTVFH